MILKSLHLTNFRNYASASFDFSPTTTLVVGPNTSGKTNLLEAIYFLACGKSFRAAYDREAIRSGEGFARIEGIKGVREEDEGDEGSLEVQIVAGDGVDGNVSRKRFQVNGIKRRLSDFAGNLRAVYFGPEEIELVTGPPSRRRKYLDSVLVQVDREYARALLEYEKVLRQRNRLLLLIRAGEARREQLEVWDPKLTALGAVVSARRQEMVENFNKRLEEHLRLLLIQPRPLLNESTVREREVAAGMTLWGPHRDDFGFQKTFENGPERLGKLSRSENSENSVNQKIRAPESQRIGNSDLSDTLMHRRSDAPSYSDLPSRSDFSDLSSYGSRGEQRLAVLHLKLAELEFITNKVGERPVLLLDDIFSELDESNRERVLSLLGAQQTIITSTEADVISSKVKAQMSKVQLKCQK